MTEQHAKAAHEIVHLAGDEKRGITVSHELTKTALMTFSLEYTGRHAMPFPRKLIEGEVYTVPGGGLMVHTICPRCNNALRITSDNKDISIDKDRGAIWVEPFECSWELGERDGERMDFGLGLCKTRLAYDGKVAKDA
jgi:hypothetical protein